MAPPRGGAAAAAPAALDLTGVHILEASSVPPLPERGGNAVQRKEAVDPDKDRKKEKAAAPRITGWGLREYSKIVCEKVEAKGRTTYNEVADEIYSELKSMAHIGQGEVRKELTNKIRNKKALLQEIEKQFDDLQNIKLRNQTLESSAENVNGIRLPFVLVKTSRKARVEIEISDDSKFAHFEFNGAPFTLHDDLSILEGIRRNSIGRAGRATLH
ncbi:transcription factor-like protein DPA isoform X2 [Triticum dicoccoides]|uniref:transcription factor-like protein DPA isoform X2 n=1 Tax=Triticum dicoccoides TaxID=85692 RepID=UPI0018904302|nr:transcription factor-like protein DPA isoform X2 [Triticum dicoccoides]